MFVGWGQEFRGCIALHQQRWWSCHRSGVKRASSSLHSRPIRIHTQLKKRRKSQSPNPQTPKWHQELEGGGIYDVLPCPEKYVLGLWSDASPRNEPFCALEFPFNLGLLFALDGVKPPDEHRPMGWRSYADILQHLEQRLLRRLKFDVNIMACRWRWCNLSNDLSTSQSNQNVLMVKYSRTWNALCSNNLSDDMRQHSNTSTTKPGSQATYTGMSSIIRGWEARFVQTRPQKIHYSIYFYSILHSRSVVEKVKTKT